MSDTNPTTPPDEIDLRQVAAVLWRRRFAILAVGVLGGAIGVAVSLMSTQYVSSGLLQVPTSVRLETESVNAVTYKRYESMLFDPRNLQQFLSRLPSDTPGLAQLAPLVDSPPTLRATLTPEFSLTDKEQRALGVKLSAEQAGTLMGFRVRYASPEPNHGTALQLLGEYLHDSVLRLDLRRYMAEQCEMHQAREVELRNEQLKADFFIEQEERRMQHLKRLIAQGPAATADNRPVISLDSSSVRYLSPRVHLNASEIAIADARLAQSQRARDTTASAIKKRYYCEAARLQADNLSARAYLDRLPSVQTAAVETQDKDHSVVEQTTNELTLQLRAWRDHYLRAMRYVTPASDTLENKERKPPLMFGLALGGLLGGLLGVVTALLRDWWRHNRQAILAKD